MSNPTYAKVQEGAKLAREKQVSMILVLAGIEALADFIKEIGLPCSLQELGIKDKSILKEIANSCNISLGSYKKITHEEILEIFEECFDS